MTRPGAQELPVPPGFERTHMERMAVQWPQLSRNVFAEGRDCYGDPDRAAYVEASYSPLDEAVAGASAGEQVLLVGRQPETSMKNGFGRVMALGELAGDGSGLMLGFRDGEIVLPTSRYALLLRHSISRLSGYRPPTLHEGALRSGIAVANEGLLPPKHDLMDSALYTKLPASGRSRGLRSDEEEEMWDRTAQIAIGDEDVETLMWSLMNTGSRLSQTMFQRDFALLHGTLTGAPEVPATELPETTAA